MAGFVPDASVTLPWCFEDEATPRTEALLTRLRSGEEATVPANWPSEVANGLLMAVRRGRISKDKRARFLGDLRSLPIRIDPESIQEAFGRALTLAEKHNLTAYDAGYLEAALRRRLPLATLDEAIIGAAQAEGVIVL